VLLDHPIQVNIDERKTRARAPVSEKPILDMFRLQRLAEQRVVLQVDHAEAEIITSAPVCMDFAKRVGAERLA
jgi:hypothetical protein